MFYNISHSVNKNIHPLKIADWPILMDSTIKPSMLNNLSKLINEPIQPITILSATVWLNQIATF
jgi:hypothetical protein